MLVELKIASFICKTQQNSTESSISRCSVKISSRVSRIFVLRGHSFSLLFSSIAHRQNSFMATARYFCQRLPVNIDVMITCPILILWQKWQVHLISVTDDYSSNNIATVGRQQQQVNLANTYFHIASSLFASSRSILTLSRFERCVNACCYCCYCYYCCYCCSLRAANCSVNMKSGKKNTLSALIGIR